MSSAVTVGGPGARARAATVATKVRIIGCPPADAVFRAEHGDRRDAVTGVVERRSARAAGRHRRRPTAGPRSRSYVPHSPRSFLSDPLLGSKVTDMESFQSIVHRV